MEPYPHITRGRHGTWAPLAAARRPRRRKPLLLAGAGFGAVVLAATALLASGVLNPPTMTVHGFDHLWIRNPAKVTIQSAYPDIATGSPVTVISPSGAVLGTGVLIAADPGSWGIQDAVYAFTITVPAGEPRYGIKIGGNGGTAWFSGAQMRAGPDISLIR